MNPMIWKMSGPFDPKIKAALPDCNRQSGDRSGIMLSRQFPTSILTDTGIFIKKCLYHAHGLAERLGYVLFYYIEEALQYEDKNAIWRLFPEAFG